MRVAFTLILCIALPACSETTIETPKNHPANPSVHPAAPPHPPAVLKSDFDPFAAYPDEAEDAQSGSGHDHASHAESPREPPGGASEPATYTCPMHPEVTSPAPGECPICGMKLVPKAPAKRSP